MYELSNPGSGAGGKPPTAAPQRVSARAASGPPRPTATQLLQGADAAAGVASGGAGAGAASGRGGGGFGGGGGQLTGFEGCQGIFGMEGVSPAYKAGSCQVFHSGKVMVLQGLLMAIKKCDPTDKVGGWHDTGAAARYACSKLLLPQHRRQKERCYHGQCFPMA